MYKDEESGFDIINFGGPGAIGFNIFYSYNPYGASSLIGVEFDYFYLWIYILFFKIRIDV